ncbi:type VI secretion system ATPase TssH [Rhizobium laguerreae]|uniref:type VI secretion system ATPase TssH n=1 Tax=Rhizobium laguerreae TaxID=1076926 RepID=UPI001C903A4F|nr:type VI secretion system ATPase TssH [Rhizobium laguerreae]MBY3347986.1 type VI secretion system ATPase TssH [Rhizobium laguerreae]MBY3354949.1 type VI secretion system ATPase TssH [Rhizobium laguerreae]MBY3376254.1 type VI secretion system ATPase TssH [Rhizobium laguerreae]MBY3431253.1 type VI secretion system ATPase TssH [Rhizobium laguerreae]MBY3439869.1 type VI secretion system ATPase TssH [Rhizobium laguerreae]
MSEISLETVTGKLNTVGYEAFMKALRHAKSMGNRNVEPAHWFFHLLQNERCDIACILDKLKIDRGRVLSDITSAVTSLRGNQTEMPSISPHLFDLLDRGWHYATLQFGELQIRTGHLLIAGVKSNDIARALNSLSPLFGKINPVQLVEEFAALTEHSVERDARPIDGTAPSTHWDPAASTATKGTTALARFTVDMTEQAASGKLDPVLGRDEEIRQIIDVLSRRRQNNPILTGEAGVGKTAVVEGFAQRIVAGDVPPALQNVRLLALDIGLMQAGASMKGEFEQRLRSVIDEVQSSPTPIILFIDEAHTLIGAGGAAGTGDAANLLKPALARGTLRTIGATTWSEYRQFFEKDPALTRRFQHIAVGEPSIEKCCFMLRGILPAMEKHHNVRIADAALVAAVELSVRYIPARQLPDKAVSLLDTACARVAISQKTQPAAIEDLKAAISSAENELSALEKDKELGRDSTKRIEELRTIIADRNSILSAKEGTLAHERKIVDDIVALRSHKHANDQPATEEPTTSPILDLLDELEKIGPDDRMLHAYVDDQAVAAVVSAWTGVPIGRMVRSEIQSIIELPEILNQRVIGQSHGLDLIAKRIAINRARLDNPGKPIGVFMLCGPSGVGKTETALALAEAIYGGEQNMVTINMSEFQEAHSVSLLKGAPPGYVGYGEGGRLTEAVRRKPYSAVLLDEVEKAHSDVHELFFQVFDKGRMEDGTGREIDFKNTLIILTSNVGTEVIMEMTDYGRQAPDMERLGAALRPALLEHFPPALLGRIVVIPYMPLSETTLGRIVRLQLDLVGRRIKTNYDATFDYSDAVVAHIVSRCNEPDSGGRMIDNIIMNQLLPRLAGIFLARSIDRLASTAVAIGVIDNDFTYEVT